MLNKTWKNKSYLMENNMAEIPPTFEQCPLCDHWQIKLKKVKTLKAMAEVRKELDSILFR
jgi:hypothetical protein